MIADLDNLKDVVKKIDLLVKKCNIVLLIGDLASGKTTLVKEFVKYKKIDSLVTSPTFSIQQIYKGNSLNIYHYDLYNKTLEEFLALGLLEEFENDGIHFVEWANDSLKDILLDYGYNLLIVEIEKLKDKREYKIKCID